MIYDWDYDGDSGLIHKHCGLRQICYRNTSICEGVNLCVSVDTDAGIPVPFPDAYSCVLLWCCELSISISVPA